jgi:hypothetical protein
MILLTIKIWLVCWFITEFEPIQERFDKIFPWLEAGTKDKSALKLLDGLYIISGCFKCLSFWSVLAITCNPFLAIAASMAGQAFSKLFKD